MTVVFLFFLLFIMLLVLFLFIFTLTRFAQGSPYRYFLLKPFLHKVCMNVLTTVKTTVILVLSLLHSLLEFSYPSFWCSLSLTVQFTVIVLLNHSMSLLLNPSLILIVIVISNFLSSSFFFALPFSSYLSFPVSPQGPPSPLDFHFFL